MTAGSRTGSGARQRHASVLFVCLGNICRSPLAEGVLDHLVREAGHDGRVRVDSAGTGAYHVGEAPDPRARRVAGARGIELRGRARQVTPEDLDAFDHVLAMDRDNLRRLEELKRARGGRARVELLRSYDPMAGDDLDVPDPYYGGPRGFEEVFDMVHRSCRALLQQLVEEPSRDE